jgi:hypothetical protein
MPSWLTVYMAMIHLQMKQYDLARADLETAMDKA